MQPQPPMNVAIRAPRSTDQGYIASTWLRSMTRGTRRKTRDERVAGSIDRVLDHVSTAILVACNHDEQDRIIGWVCWAKLPTRCLHYLYVREQHRKKGVAKQLLTAARLDGTGPLVVTHKGPSSHWAWEKYGATYTPVRELLG